MFNKFKINEIVLCLILDKKTGKYIKRKGKILEKDYFFKDYCVKFEDNSEEWISEKNIQKFK